MLGKLLNERYLVLKELGSGGFSTTYLCRDSSLPDDPICVVKFMSQHPDLSDAEVERLYLREAEILYKLKHPQIPTLLTRRIENEQRYLVIEYIEGDDLAQLLTQKQLSQRQILSLLEGLFEVLKFIHSRQILHRDIKPSNLIWRHRDRKLVLIDFGSAIDLTRDHQAQRFGTHGYMPPEQQDDGNLTFRSDLYAAGITAIELLTGVPPGQLPRNPETGEFVLEPLLKQHRVPARLIEILTKLTRFQAKHRYANANQVLNDLKKLSRPQPAKPKSSNWIIQHPVLKLLFAGTLGATTLLAMGNGQVSLPGVPLQNLREAILELMPRQLLPAALQPPQLSVQPVRSVQTGLLEQVVGGNELITRDIEDQVTIWNWDGTKLIQLPARPRQDIQHMVLSPNGNRLALLYNQEIQVWSVPDGELKRTLPLPMRSMQVIALGINGARLATTDGQRIQIWDLRKSQLVQEIDARAWGDRITFLSYLPNNLLACGSPDHRLHLWDAGLGRRTQTFAGHQASVTQAQLSPNYQQLYTLGQDRLLTWNWQKRSIEQVFPLQSGAMIQLAASANFLVGLHSEGRLSLWNSNSGRLLDAHAPYSGLVAINGMGTSLAQSQNDQLTFYSINFTNYGNP
ncbi:protein kinase [Cyanobacteria bacterium FACHB-502]|nr:protein kinase [Cyanobacteria bacterium FACHB-502]